MHRLSKQTDRQTLREEKHRRCVELEQSEKRTAGEDLTNLQDLFLKLNPFKLFLMASPETLHTTPNKYSSTIDDSMIDSMIDHTDLRERDS